MLKTISGRGGLSVALALMLGTIMPMSASALMIGVDMDPSTAGIQSSRTLDIGESFSVDVVIENATTPITSFEFALNFDPSVLMATGVFSGAFLPSITVPVANQILPGMVLFAETAINVIPPLPGVPPLPFGSTGDGILAQITFEAIGAGVSALNLSPLLITGSVFNPSLPAFAPAPLTPDSLNNGQANVASVVGQVPEPSVMLLVAIGLLGLATFTRLSRRRSQRSLGESVSAFLIKGRAA